MSLIKENNLEQGAYLGWGEKHHILFAWMCRGCPNNKLKEKCLICFGYPLEEDKNEEQK